MARLGEVALGSAVPRLLVLSLWLGAGAGGACTTNHDALARQPKAGSSGGGAGGGAGFGAGGFGNSGGSSAEGGRRNLDDEAKGKDVLTIVNGVVDAPSVRLCFAHVGAEGETTELVGEPLPELAYAASTFVTELDGFSFADDELQPWVIAGDFSLIEGLSCEAAVALAASEEAKVTPPSDAAGEGGSGGEPEKAPLVPPTLRARPLAALPAGTVNIGRSILLTLSGCLGGAAYGDPIDTAVCGPDYAPDVPTVQPVVVKLSRALGFDKVGLQAVHASLSTETLDVRASDAVNAVSLVFASDVGFGAIDPRPADIRFTPAELGVGTVADGLQAVGENGNVVYSESWSKILKASGIEAVVAARTYTAVFLGPEPLLLKKGWWNGSAFALVDNDPTRE